MYCNRDVTQTLPDLGKVMLLRLPASRAVPLVNPPYAAGSLVVPAAMFEIPSPAAVAAAVGALRGRAHRPVAFGATRNGAANSPLNERGERSCSSDEKVHAERIKAFPVGFFTLRLAVTDGGCFLPTLTVG